MKSQPIEPEVVALALSPSPKDLFIPSTGKTTIIAMGILSDGRTVSQDIVIQFRPGQGIGDILWTALEVVKRVGGLIEDADDGIVFHPLSIFERGVKLSEKEKS